MRREAVRDGKGHEFTRAVALRQRARGRRPTADFGDAGVSNEVAAGGGA